MCGCSRHALHKCPRPQKREEGWNTVHQWGPSWWMDQAGNSRTPTNATSLKETTRCDRPPDEATGDTVKELFLKNKTKPLKPNLIDPLDQGSSNYGLPAKSSPLPDFVNKVSLRPSHTHLFTYRQWLLLPHSGRVGTIWPAKPRISIIWIFREKFHQPPC